MGDSGGRLPDTQNAIAIAIAVAIEKLLIPVAAQEPKGTGRGTGQGLRQKARRQGHGKNLREPSSQEDRAPVFSVFCLGISRDPFPCPRPPSNRAQTFFSIGVAIRVEMRDVEV